MKQFEIYRIADLSRSPYVILKEVSKNTVMVAPVHMDEFIINFDSISVFNKSMFAEKVRDCNTDEINTINQKIEKMKEGR